MLKIVSINSLNHPEVTRLASRKASSSPQVATAVRRILRRVKLHGHKAAVDLACRYDGLRGNLRVTRRQLEQRAGKCPPALKAPVRRAIRNIRAYHKNQIERSWKAVGQDKVVLGQIIRPLNRVGVYVPGGSGVYPSTVMMNVIPARIAGVKEIVVATPAAGEIDPVMAMILMELHIEEVYRIGGAQAVAMLAYGTEKVERVDKIVGPGNNYVSLAKKEVFGEVDIDMIAGPSEILVLADDSSDPDWVAADLLAQAEHGTGDEAAVCITTCAKTAKFVQICAGQQVSRSPKKEILNRVLRRYGRIMVVNDWETGCALANQLAPEHLELMLASWKTLITKIHNAGAVFAGPWSAEPIGDYFAGPNHVLPTNGTARFFSPLGVYDFYKRSSFIEYSREALRKNGKSVHALAEAEGFFHHAQSVAKRM